MQRGAQAAPRLKGDLRLAQAGGRDQTGQGKDFAGTPLAKPEKPRSRAEGRRLAGPIQVGISRSLVEAKGISDGKPVRFWFSPLSTVNTFFINLNRLLKGKKRKTEGLQDRETISCRRKG
jgi:hypothetical protein